MRTTSTLLAAALASITACKESTPPPPAPPAANPATMARTQTALPSGQGIHGKLAEKMDSGGYTYLRITTAAGDTWAAVPQAQVTVGADIDVAVQMTMEGFTSKTLNRTFDKIIFGTLPGAAAAAPGPGMGMGAPAAPAANGFAAAAPAAAGAVPAMPAMPAAAPAAAVATGPVAKATGPNARTVAEIWTEKAKLKDAAVTIHARVVKVTEGVLGKNWLHLKDGSGAPGSDDITVTTTSKAAVGDVITIKGVVHLDRDFGSGYSYAVLIEEATLEI
jgi:hypothetical protein